MSVEVSAQAALPAGKYFLQLGGIDVVDVPVTFQFFHMKIFDSLSNVITETTAPSKIFYAFETNIMSLKLESPNFLINHKKARSIFSFQLSVNNRPIYEDEKLVFDLDVLNEDNPTYILDIVIKDMLNSNAISDVWKSCTLDAVGKFKKVTLIPNKDIDLVNHKYLIEFHNIYTPSQTQNYGISVFL